LSKYKFKYWNTHSSTGKEVTKEEKEARAAEIASKLCKHSDWLTHGRSIKIQDFSEMRLLVNDYSTNLLLEDAITRYYTLLRMTFESTNIYKLFETPFSQIYRFTLGGSPLIPNPPIQASQQNELAVIDFECPNCKNHSKIQANINRHSEIQSGNIPYPIKDNVFICPKCGSANNILPIKLQIEAQSGKKIVE
jgi:hypothetical protein